MSMFTCLLPCYNLVLSDYRLCTFSFEESSSSAEWWIAVEEVTWDRHGIKKRGTRSVRSVTVKGSFSLNQDHYFLFVLWRMSYAKKDIEPAVAVYRMFSPILSDSNVQVSTSTRCPFRLDSAPKGFQWECLPPRRYPQARLNFGFH